MYTGRCSFSKVYGNLQVKGYALSHNILCLMILHHANDCFYLTAFQALLGYLELKGIWQLSRLFTSVALLSRYEGGTSKLVLLIRTSLLSVLSIIKFLRGHLTF